MPGDCHYLEGNLNARRRVEYIQKLLEEIGLNSQRLQMINISSAMGNEFAHAAEELTQQIIELGPNPLKNGVSRISQEQEI
jgi:coenzyme F420-reducing hydrogenase delta subunit